MKELHSDSNGGSSTDGRGARRGPYYLLMFLLGVGVTVAWRHPEVRNHPIVKKYLGDYMGSNDEIKLAKVERLPKHDIVKMDEEQCVPKELNQEKVKQEVCALPQENSNAGASKSASSSNHLVVAKEPSGSTSSQDAGKSNPGSSEEKKSYHSLLEKKESLLKELETEINHLRSYLIQNELFTEKRERQFDELSTELKHVHSYLLNKEHDASLKDREIDSLTKSLSNAQRKMESTVEQLREEHQQKIVELEQLHKTEMEEVEGNLDLMLDDQKKILEQEFLKKNQARIERLRQLTEKVYAVEESFYRSSSYLINSVRLQKITAATLALQQILKSDAPFSPEMQVLKEEGYGDRLIEDMVYAIPKDVQREGLPRRHDLYRQFCNIDRQVLEASYIPSTAGFFGLLYSKIVGRLLIQERGLVDGDSVDAKLARARVFLANDNLALAVSELSDIKGEAREVLQPWLTQAQYRLVADQSIEILHAHITNLSASLIDVQKQ